MRVASTMLVALLLTGCEGEPVGPAPDPEEMFEYESKPVGDAGAETYRDEAVPAVEIEVPVEKPARE